MPHTGIALEIGRAVPLTVGIVPEPDRHAGKCRGADELAFPLAHASALVIEDLDAHAEPATLNLAAINRQQWIAERETRNDVGAARDRGELHTTLDRPVD